MDISKEEAAARLRLAEFPRSGRYDPEWVLATEMGPNVLWLTEALAETMRLEAGMRVLDMGCGKAASSIFLAREYGVQVWAVDLWIDATDNWKRIRAAGAGDRVFPVHAEAHALPFAEEFFDAAVSLDSYQYYGTDDLYLDRFVRFVRPGGQIGIVVPGLVREFEGGVPEHLTRPTPTGGRFWDPGECFCFHTAAWWRGHFAQTERVDVERADLVPDGWRHWLLFEEVKRDAGTSRGVDEIPALQADRGRYLGFVRVVARRRTPAP